ncbi:kinase-like domain-containing protein [Rhizophagus irregularis DAOM 181602=DAOM 197198]|nr:kinase-like domain-containing protein [Rhizophagus irregularis DAOM 181602=DAOM 197198]
MENLEWIEYDRFENVEYLAEGGFGIIYKAIWKDGYIKRWDSENNRWERSKHFGTDYKNNFPIILKCLHNSQDITSEFFREIESHITIISEYAKDGSLRQYLNNRFNSIKWVDKLGYLVDISRGLNSIHEKGLIHHDFHCGNMLRDVSSLYHSSRHSDDHKIKKQIEEADKINEKLTSSSLSYNEPKNAIDNKDDVDYSESIEAIDFTKLNLDENN